MHLLISREAFKAICAASKNNGRRGARCVTKTVHLVAAELRRKLQEASQIWLLGAWQVFPEHVQAEAKLHPTPQRPPMQAKQEPSAVEVESCIMRTFLSFYHRHVAGGFP